MHTLGTLHIDPQDPTLLRSQRGRRTAITSCQNPLPQDNSQEMRDATNIDNARRIAALWNLMESYSTTELEALQENR